MVMKFGLAAVVLAACYSPSPPAGAPCANGVCPDPLVCSPATNTCEASAATADGQVVDGPVIDAPVDAAIDANLIDAPPDAPHVDPFAPLNNAQWKLPCTGTPGSNGLCPATSASHDIQLMDSATTHYQVTLRIRAIVEGANYGSGSAVAGTEAYIGGVPGTNYLTTLELIVSSPAQHYYLNNGSGVPTVIDETFPIEIDSTAKVTLFISAQDGVEEPNDDGSGSPIVIPNVTTVPSPFNGEFAQLNVTDEVKM